jgi:hypothetical protein
MGIKKNVFGSKQERRHYIQLQKTWGDKYNIYHNLPFLAVFAAKEEMLDSKLSDAEYDLLKKTSIDFTICDKHDSPLMCLEFDGFQDGFNFGTTYQLRDGSSSMLGRKALIELKLRFSHSFCFPYLVLGIEEFRGFSDAIRLKIVDGIIGEVMSLRNVQKHVNAGFEPSECGFSTEEFCEMSEDEKSEIIGNWLTNIEIESDFAYNPITLEAAKLSKELKVNGCTYSFLNDKKLDVEKWVSLDCEVTSTLNDTAKAGICLPNYKTPYCHTSVHLAMEIAELLALDKLRQKAKRKNRVLQS